MIPVAATRGGSRPAALPWVVVFPALILASAIGCAARGEAPATAPDAATGRPASSTPAPSAVPAGAPRLAPPRAATTLAGPVASLSAEIDRLFAAPVLGNAVVGALVQSLDTGQVLYRLNPDTLAVPASNMKIVTTAVGATRLGWDYRYETRIEATGPIEAGVLRGDLVVTGSGDPTINGRNGNRFATFREWASQLEALGVSRIEGRIVGDDDAFDDERFGDGWSWDDFVFGYAAPVGALQFNENLVGVVVRPGAAEGERASVDLDAPSSDLRLAEANVTTSPHGSRRDLSMSRFPGRPELHIAGSIALGSEPATLEAAVDNPTLYFVTALRDTLRAEGIDVEGQAVDIDEASDAADLKASASRRRQLFAHQSPPLSEIAKPLMKVSQNLYAETVFRTLSLAPGPATIAASRQQVADTLGRWGLVPGQFIVADGSGLSRFNFLSATAVVTILRAMARDAKILAAFEATFPIAGRDGSLAGRMKATRAEGNAIAKTGTLSNVRSLSGYVRTPGGERLVFSFLVNNFSVPSATVDAIVDQAVERLAHFTR